MMENIEINVPKHFDYCLEIRNEITEFLDKYNIQLLQLTNDEYKDFHTTYIHIDISDIGEILQTNNTITILFRIVCATRGGIELREVERTVNTIDIDNIEYTVKYNISDIKFIESTCFDKFKAYSRDIIDDSIKELIGTSITFIIQK